MIYKSVFAVLFLLNISARGQTGNVVLDGTLHKKENVNSICIRNIDGIDLKVPLNKANHFSLNAALQPGFYMVDEIGTVYLHPGYNLSIYPDGDDLYKFAGTGSLENNIFRATKLQLGNYVPLDSTGDLDQAAYYMELPLLLAKLDSFLLGSAQLVNKSKDTFFCKYALLDLKFYTRELLYDYFALYGTD